MVKIIKITTKKCAEFLSLLQNLSVKGDVNKVECVINQSIVLFKAINVSNTCLYSITIKKDFFDTIEGEGSFFFNPLDLDIKSSKANIIEFCVSDHIVLSMYGKNKKVYSVGLNQDSEKVRVPQVEAKNKWNVKKPDVKEIIDFANSDDTLKLNSDEQKITVSCIKGQFNNYMDIQKSDEDVLSKAKVGVSSDFLKKYTDMHFNEMVFEWSEFKPIGITSHTENISVYTIIAPRVEKNEG